MSISFTCDHCGKGFNVDDKFAGKQGRCKQCGSVMQIPANSASRRSETISRDISAPEISPSRRALATASAVRPPVEDVYGFDDPPQSRPGTSMLTEDEPAPPTRARQRAAGASKGSKKPAKPLYPGGPTVGGAFKRVAIGIIAGLVGLIVKTVVIPAFQRGGDPNWSSRSRLESVIKRQLDGTVELTGILRGVTDADSARAASPGANAALRGLTENLRSNKDRKGNQKDIDALKGKYEDQLRRTAQDLFGELARVGLIPGAVDALAIEEAARDLSAVGSTMPGGNPGPDFTPPPPPRLPRITSGFPPGVGPGTGMPPRPGRGRPGFVPGGPPGFTPVGPDDLPN